MLHHTEIVIIYWWSFQPTTTNRLCLNAGTEQKRDADIPVRAYAIAQKGRASGSFADSAAVPNPWQLDAVATPRAMGSWNRSLSSTTFTKFAPTKPVSTTTAAVMDELATSKSEAMLSANATVIHLGRLDTVRYRSSPTSRPTSAVEYNENKAEMITAVKISVACLLTSWKTYK